MNAECSTLGNGLLAAWTGILRSLGMVARGNESVPNRLPATILSRAAAKEPSRAYEEPRPRSGATPRASAYIRGSIAVLAFAATMAAPRAAAAEVARIEITRREPVLGGRPFGIAGPYEKLVGRVWFAVDPRHPRNAAIADLARAPRNERGEVEFSADLYVLRPVDSTRGNRTALVEIANRGGKQLLTFFSTAQGSPDPTDSAHFGDRFLLERGYTLVWVGWQFDVPEQGGRVALRAPIAVGGDGRPITGLVRADYVVNEPLPDRPLADGDHRPFPAHDPRDPRNVLTVREREHDPRRTIPRAEWSFARVRDGREVPDSTWIALRGGFQPGRIYEITWVAANPPVSGLGFAAVRDLVSHLKHAPGAPAPARAAIGFGISQSGRFLRTFLYQGFNADEEGRRVFDGVMAHIAGAGRGNFNHRFAQPSRASAPLSSLDFPNDLYPFADEPARDPTTGERAGLLDRTRQLGVVPKVMYTNTTSEYWSRAGSLVHATVDGTADVPLPDSTRLYVFAGAQHVAAGFPPGRGAGTLPDNPNRFAWHLRALLVALQRWVTTGDEPPPSVYPRIADSTLVPLDRLRFPALPQVARVPRPYVVRRLSFGAGFAEGILAPPTVGAPYVQLVPQVDADGNELGALRTPEHAVPLATYTPWNPRRAAIGFPDVTVGLLGGWIPFAATAEQRQAANDPRPSVAERHRSRDEYLGRYARAAAALVRDRYLLPQDVVPLLRLGETRWDEAVK